MSRFNYSKLTEKVGALINNNCADLSKVSGLVTVPFSKLRSVLYGIKSSVASRQSSYDAVSAAFLHEETLLDLPEDAQVRMKQVLEDADHKVRSGEGFPFVEISADQFEMMVNSLLQISKDMPEGNFLVLTDSRGYVYNIPMSCLPGDSYESVNIYTINDQQQTTPLLWTEGERCFVSLIMCPTTTVSAEIELEQSSTIFAMSSVLAYRRGYSARGTIFSLNAQGESTDESTTLADLCDPDDTHGDLSSGLADQAEEAGINVVYYDTYNGPLVATTAVFADIASSGIINDTISQMCDAALSADPATSLAAVADNLNSSSTVDQSARRMVNKARIAYAQSKLSGLVTYIGQIFKNAKGIKNDDKGYLFVQTDDADLLPKEYIAGIVTTIVTGVLQVLSMILMIVGNVWTMIIGALVAIGTAIYQAFKTDVASTNVTIQVTDDPESSSLMGFGPEALLQGVLPNSDEYLNIQNAFNVFRTAICLDVVGGTMIIGPLSYVGSGHDGKDVQYWAWEFHPKARLILRKQENPIRRADLLYRSLFEHHNYVEREDTSRTHDYMRSQAVYYRPDVLQAVWSEYLEKLTTDNWPVDSIADNELDYCIRANSVLCCWFFLGAFIFNQLPNDRDYRSENDYFLYDYVNFQPGNHGIVNLFYWASRIWESGFTATNLSTPSWTQILTALIDIQNFRKDPSVGYRSIWMCAGGATTVEEIYEYHVQMTEYWDRQFLISTFCSVQDAKTTLGCSNLYGLPSDVAFAYKIPKFDSATFWRNLAIAGAVTAVLVTATVAISVKYSKFAKKKRAANRARFEEAQSTYNDAINGRETYIGDDGIERVREFDVNSEEGKAKIQDAYKAYKGCAFRNNLWSHLVGGSRYDINTFYGEAEAADDSDSGVSSYSSIYSPIDDSGEYDYQDSAGASASTTLIYGAITGQAYGS